jgi:MFS family permease
VGARPHRRRTAHAQGLLRRLALDAMDVQLYSFAIPALATLWQLSRGQLGLLATSALVMSAVGGWIAGYLSDRIGRVRTLQITIVWFAFFTFLSGLAQNYEQLFITRGFMGIGFGGEWAAGAVLLAETIRADRRGRALGVMSTGWAVGWGAAALLQTVLFAYLPTDLAWRVLFFAGAAPALLVFGLRRYIKDSEVYLASQAKIAASGERPSILEIVRPPLLRITILAALMSTGVQGGYFAVTTWLPTFMRVERGLSVVNTGGYLAVMITGSFFGYLAGAYLGDRIGRRPAFAFFALGSCMMVLIYTFAVIDNVFLLALGMPLGFFSAGAFSGFGPFFTELFPTRVRGVGQGFAYNFGRAVGALFPWLVGVLAERMSLGLAIGLSASSAYALMALATFGLPETRGKTLIA